MALCTLCSDIVLIAAISSCTVLPVRFNCSASSLIMIFCVLIPLFVVLDWLSESLLYTNARFRFNSNIRIFDKGEVNGHRRLGVLLARDISVEKALEKVERAYAKLDVKL